MYGDPSLIVCTATTSRIHGEAGDPLASFTPPRKCHQGESNPPPGVANRRPALVPPPILPGPDKRVRPLPAFKFILPAPPIHALRHFTPQGETAPFPGRIIRPRAFSLSGSGMPSAGSAHVVYRTLPGLSLQAGNRSRPGRPGGAWSVSFHATHASQSLHGNSIEGLFRARLRRHQLPAGIGSMFCPGARLSIPAWAPCIPGRHRLEDAGAWENTWVFAPGGKGRYSSGQKLGTFPHRMPPDATERSGTPGGVLHPQALRNDP